MVKKIFNLFVRLYSKRFIPPGEKRNVLLHGIHFPGNETFFIYEFKVHDIQIMQRLQLYEREKDVLTLNHVREYIQSIWGKNSNYSNHHINPELNGEVIIRVKLLII